MPIFSHVCMLIDVYRIIFRMFFERCDPLILTIGSLSETVLEYLLRCRNRGYVILIGDYGNFRILRYSRFSNHEYAKPRFCTVVRILERLAKAL